MSRKISNILVICAMVVIFPLLIVGTTFAAYYSINATTKVSFYTIDAVADQSVAKNAGATMSVVYNNKENAEDFEITNSHVKQISLKPTAKGYTFVGWFNGTAEDYNNAVEKKYIEENVENGTLTTKLSTYKNLLAVYKIDKYAVSYNYNADPANTADYTTTAPAGGATEYKYGAALPTLTCNHYTFNGWNVNGKIYTKATFDKSTAYQLTATAANNAWTEHAKVTVKYNVNGTETEEVIGYAEDNPALKDAATAAAGTPILVGYKWAWVDANGNQVTTASANTSVTLTPVRLVYTVNVLNGEDIEYTGASKTFDYNAVNALGDLFNNDNYNTDYSFWKIGNVEYNGTAYTTAQALQTAIQNNNTTDATVNVTANVKKNFANVTVGAVNFGSYNGTDYSGKVYKGKNAEVQSGDAVAKMASTTDIVTWLAISGTFYSDADATEEITLKTIRVVIGENGYNIDAKSVTTINDLIEKIYAEGDLTDADELAITSIKLQYV